MQKSHGLARLVPMQTIPKAQQQPLDWPRELQPHVSGYVHAQEPCVVCPSSKHQLAQHLRHFTRCCTF
eukprot:scaffold100688_cov20-Prasinocladus_malaysianus.AAC.1